MSERQRLEKAWGRVKRILDQALDLPVTERVVFLDGACGADEALRGELDSLLAADAGEEDDFLAEPLVSLRDPSQPCQPGDRLGPYELEEEIGRGGMGTVYRALRVDREDGERVAVKLLRAATEAGTELAGRLRRERQILADLDHPNIARLLDGGSSEEGLPYLVMELVEGQPLDRYCDERRLTTRERLELFHTVCAAVHYAHQNLVVHRDLKPGNILVTAAGVPKLLDFGIAKLLAPDPGSGPTLTRPGSGPLTPGYGSPEQVRGEVVTTASDIYSLGVLLYELLTGHLPYRVRSLPPEELDRVVCEVEPPRPSEAVSSTRGSRQPPTYETAAPARLIENAALSRDLEGDLDAVVMKAMRKEPDGRYASADRLAEDVQRFLDHLPVHARRGTWRYRAGKFLRRHRLRLAAAAGLVLLAATGSLVLAQHREIRTQRLAVAAERDRTDVLGELLTNAFRLSDPAHGGERDLTVREALDRAANVVAEDFRDEPELQALLFDVAGRVYRGDADYERAEPLLARALKLRRQAFGPDHLLVAASLNNLAVLHSDLNDGERALTLYREALEIQRRARENPENEARQLHNIAATLRRLGRYDEAEPVFEEVLALKRSLVGDRHPDYAKTLHNHAVLLWERGDYPAAEAELRDVVSIRRQALGDRHSATATALNTLGNLLLDTGQVAEAEAHLRESLEIRLSVYGEDHPALFTSHNSLALLAQRSGELELARTLYRDALGLATNPLQRGAVTANLAALQEAAGDFPECESLARTALSTLEKALPERHWRIAATRSILGGCLAGLGRFAEAEPLLAESHPTLRRVKGPRSPVVQAAQRRLSELRRHR